MIEILDSNFKRIGILKKYTFAQYNPKFRDIGTFKIYARMITENLYLLDENNSYYVLFDNEYLGKIENAAKDEDSEYEQIINISGRLSNLLFTKRVALGTLNFEGKTAQLVRELVYQNITKDSLSNRYIPINIVYDNEEYLLSKSSNISKQVTGGYIWEHMQEVLEQDRLGIMFRPVIVPIYLNNDSVETSVESWDLIISAGVDRTKSNSLGVPPVVFSQSLSNIARTSYSFNSEKYRNVAYVAGEGESDNRKWYEVTNSEEPQSKGWDRSELWVDARDLQTEEVATAVSDSYPQSIEQRAMEKFSENTKEKSYSATVTEGNKLYSYGKDYFLGDWCTIIDTELDKEIDVQITEVLISIQNNKHIEDIVFSYGSKKSDPIAQTKLNSEQIAQNTASIKYLENKIKSMEGTT